MEIDGTYRLAIQTRIEELLRILHLSAFGECQPHGALKRICYADDPIMKPNRDSLWFGGFFPLHFLDQARVCTLDQGPQLCQFLAPPISLLFDDGIDLLRWDSPSGKGFVSSWFMKNSLSVNRSITTKFCRSIITSNETKVKCAVRLMARLFSRL